MSWEEFIESESQKPYYRELMNFLKQESEQVAVYPPEREWLNAFKLIPLDRVKVVIIGQDPYHGAGQAMGLAFSVHQGVKLPKSLQNIYTELNDDLGIMNTSGDLSSWAKQGVFLLNTTLTVRESQPLSHRLRGWETFTSNAIEYLSTKREHLVFVLWGNHAAQFEELALSHGHTVIKSAHPSPLSAYRGFFGSRPFSKVNQALIKRGVEPIDWRIQ